MYSVHYIKFMNEISFYSKSEEYACLSNFHVAPFKLDGKSWPTVEHFFQAAKSLDECDQERIRLLATPGKAKAAGRKVLLRPDWERVKEGVMLRALKAKFSDPALRARLLETGEAVLVEAAPRDYYWGIGAKRTGKNRLGVLLMQVREELRSGKV